MDEPRLLPNEPIVAQIDAYRQSGHVLTLASEAGVSARSIHRHLSGEADRIRRGNAEAILAALARLQKRPT